jgi:hypothetical protein
VMASDRDGKRERNEDGRDEGGYRMSQTLGWLRKLGWAWPRLDWLYGGGLRPSHSPYLMYGVQHRIDIRYLAYRVDYSAG